jgi:hypothetical protein
MQGLALVEEEACSDGGRGLKFLCHMRRRIHVCHMRRRIHVF